MKFEVLYTDPYEVERKVIVFAEAADISNGTLYFVNEDSKLVNAFAPGRWNSIHEV